jgi:hypothetical protein
VDPLYLRRFAIPIRCRARARTGRRRGQLPLGLIQGKDDNGRWAGKIVASRSACHDVRLGTVEEATFKWG